MTLFPILQVLYLFVPAYAADVAPIFARELLPGWDRPIDGGRRFRGKRIFGSHKTWRGLAASALFGVLAYEAQRLLAGLGWLESLMLLDDAEPVLPGLLMGIGAGTGDAVKSFAKRQVGIAPGATWLGYDQLDFFIGAAACLSLVHAPPLGALLAAIPIVFLCDVAATTVFWRLGLKESWI
jgi:CDP-2,3-bis-(O-geranylgeranyl)-sn-glycerol synthase